MTRMGADGEAFHPRNPRFQNSLGKGMWPANHVDHSNERALHSGHGRDSRALLGIPGGERGYFSCAYSIMVVSFFGVTPATRAIRALYFMGNRRRKEFHAPASIDFEQNGFVNRIGCCERVLPFNLAMLQLD